MENNIYIIILGLIAGFSTLIGSLFVFFKQKENHIVIILGVSIGILFALAFGELLHESFEIVENIYLSFLNILIFSCLGYFITKYIDKFIHKDKDIIHTGLLTTIGLNIHRIPEGIILGIVASSDIKLGLILAFGVSLHHIPEGAIISMPVYYSTKNRFKAIKASFYSGFSTVFGVVIGLLIVNNISSLFFISVLFNITIGMLIYIILNELIDTALSYKKNKLLILSILASIAIMNIIHLFFH